MYKITIINNGIENYPIASYCVRANSYEDALVAAVSISGTSNAIKIIDY